MKKLAALLAVVSLGLVGCGGGDKEAEPSATQPPVAASGQVPFDRAFIDAMVPHHESAIQMARQAKGDGLTQPDLIKIADDIIANQQTEIDQLLAWRQEWFGSKEPGPEEAALAELGLSASEAGMDDMDMDMPMGDDVDKAFAEMMTAHHEGAIRIANLAKQRADHDEIKKVASEIIAAQQREVDIMKKYTGGAQS